ncbi:MAG: hypothetical protein JW959_01165 [Pirellulales bacterium]|nr:hypothetical protein [Pirellulales bacterium]
MTSLNHDDRSTIAPARSLLGALRRRIRQYVWLEGLAAALALLGVAFWATLAADWFFEPSPPVRAIILVALAATLVYVLFRMIGRRAFVPITDVNAATVLERRFPRLNDALLTAVELGGRSMENELSAQMLSRTCREASERVGEVELRKVFNPRPLWLHCGAASLLTISVAMFALMFTGAFGIWANRVLALSGELWPRYCKIIVDGFSDDGVRKVARGSDVEITAKADTEMPRVPEKVEIRYRTEGGGRGRATMNRRGASLGDHYREFSHTFRGVLSDIELDVVGGDDRVGGLRIQAVDSPTISRMTLDCEPPPYIRREQPPLEVTGVMQIPMGSRVTVRAKEANKELVRVQIDELVAERAAKSEILEADRLDADRRGFSHAVERLDESATLLFTLTDADGITGRDPVRLVLVAAADQPPQTAVQLDGIGTAITPQARIPVVGRIADDYGLGRIWFEYVIDDREPDDDRTIADPPDAPAAYNLDGAALEVRSLELKPGQKLVVSVRASDLCDLGKGPNIAASERWLLEIVAPDQLRVMLEARELVLRQRFERTLQEATETRDLLARLAFESDGSAPPAAAPAGSEPGDAPDNVDATDTPERRAALRTLRVQSALGNCRKNAQEVLGVAEAFDDIRKQLVNNRIDTEELKQRLQGGISLPLHRVAGEMFPELEQRIEALLADLEKPRGPELRNRAQRQADDILLEMRKVLDQMLELESFNEAVELLRNIVEMQKELKEETQRRHKEKIRDLLKE